jgi:four helix bundle protein
MGRFQDLEVWKLAKDLAKKVYEVSGPKQFKNDFGFMDQIRRATISISSNIAEGEESGYLKTSLKHFRISKGSNAEVRSQAIVANDIGYLSEEEMNEIVEMSNQISKKLFFLIKYRESLLEKSSR